MKRDPEPRLTRSGTELSGALRLWTEPLVLLALAFASLGWWYRATVASMIEQWRGNETFAHGFLILPISLWLIWGRREALARLRPQPSAWPLLPMAALGFIWLLGDLAEVQAVRQYAFVLMIPLTAWAILGARVTRAIAFPLAFLAFAVPFGEFLLPPLMSFTADFTVTALQLTGIPVYREGLYFTVPTGTWSVVEACSGLRYLIASLTLGCLYAYLSYRSWKYRFAFVSLSLAVPLLANGLRAYLIVLIGHFSNMRLAVGVDHLIYGWLFFGLVMLLLFWAGSFWREDLQPGAPLARELDSGGASRAPPLSKAVAIAISAALVAALWPVYAARIELAPESIPAVHLRPPVVAGWELTAPRVAFLPRYLGPRAVTSLWYEKDGQRVALFIGYYNHQNDQVKLVSSQNRLVGPKDHEWAAVATSHRALVSGPFRVRVNETSLRGTAQQLLVWDWFWVAGQYTGNPYLAKLLQAEARLMGKGDDSAVIIVYSPFDIGPERASAALQAFLSDALPALEKSLRDVR